jgi:hypothetical protein
MDAIMHDGMDVDMDRQQGHDRAGAGLQLQVNTNARFGFVFILLLLSFCFELRRVSVCFFPFDSAWVRLSYNDNSYTVHEPKADHPRTLPSFRFVPLLTTTSPGSHTCA